MAIIYRSPKGEPRESAGAALAWAPSAPSLVGLQRYDWDGQDRDGNPLSVTWFVGNASGRLRGAYEITGD